MIERIAGGWRYRVVAAAAAAAVGRVVEAVDIVALLSVLTASVARSRRGGSLSLEWGCLRRGPIEHKNHKIKKKVTIFGWTQEATNVLQLWIRVVLEAPERIPERIFLGRGLAYVLRSP
jgi:hypothetical protein